MNFEKHKISMAERDRLVNKYVDSRKVDEFSPISFSFDMKQVREFVDQNSAAEIFTATKALTDHGTETIVLTAKYEDGSLSESALELARPCPPYCP